MRFWEVIYILLKNIYLMALGYVIIWNIFIFYCWHDLLIWSLIILRYILNEFIFTLSIPFYIKLIDGGLFLRDIIILIHMWCCYITINVLTLIKFSTKIPLQSILEVLWRIDIIRTRIKINYWPILIVAISRRS